MKTVKERANAKINLFLDVLGLREDGFHDIKTVMHSVNFGDEITVSVAPSEKTKVTLILKGNKYLPTDSKNLAVRAAQLYLEKIGLNEDVTINMVKRIPVAAGLAGGSSDAAAVLRAMNKLHRRFFSNQALASLAAELGSDVVYCLYGKTALCEGRGEKITRIPIQIDKFFVIAIANEHVSTPFAYKKLDEFYADGFMTGGEEYYKKLSASLSNGVLDTDGLFNVFEKAVLTKCKGAARIKEILYELGAEGALMSGSGPSVFGVFSTLEAAKSACRELITLKFKAYYAASV